MTSLLLTLDKNSAIDLYSLLKKETFLPDGLLRLAKEVEEYIYRNLTLEEIESID